MKRSHLSVETLEGRALMSASATVVGGDLWVTGGSGNDYVQVSQTGANTFTVANLYGTGSTTTHTGVTGNVNINMNSGNDLLILGQYNGPTTNAIDVNINMGAHDDRVFMYSVWAADDLSANGGSGRDMIYVKDSNVGFLGLAGTHNATFTSFDKAYSGGSATNPTTTNHAVDIQNSGIEGNLVITTDDGVVRKKVNLQNSYVGGETLIEMLNGGDNWVSINGSYLNDDLTIRTGSGKDRVDLLGSQIGISRGSIADTRIETGGGNDIITLRDSSTSNALYVVAGDGDDKVLVDTFSANFSSFNGGNGTKDSLSLTDLSGPYNIGGFEYL